MIKYEKFSKTQIFFGACLGFVFSLLTWTVQQFVDSYKTETINRQIRQNMVEDLGTEVALLKADYVDLRKHSFHIHREKIDYFEINYHKFFVIPDNEIRQVLIACFKSVPPNNYEISAANYDSKNLNETGRHLYNTLIILTAAKRNNYNFDFNIRMLKEIRDKFIYDKSTEEK